MPASDLYRIVGMLFIPPRNQIIARLADVLGIGDVAPKTAPSPRAGRSFGLCDLSADRADAAD